VETYLDTVGIILGWPLRISDEVLAAVQAKIEAK
jgi:hypothetical protein